MVPKTGDLKGSSPLPPSCSGRMEGREQEGDIMGRKRDMHEGRGSAAGWATGHMERVVAGSRELTPTPGLQQKQRPPARAAGPWAPSWHPCGNSSSTATCGDCSSVARLGDCSEPAKRPEEEGPVVGGTRWGVTAVTSAAARFGGGWGAGGWRGAGESQATGQGRRPAARWQCRVSLGLGLSAGRSTALNPKPQACWAEGWEWEV